MGWEFRERGGCYYYRKERDGSRVRSVYVGKAGNDTARMLASFEVLRRDEDKERRDSEKELRAFDERLDRALDNLSELTGLLTVAALLASGYHTHNRQWRRKR
jgi:hypothetical protein